MPGNGTVGDLGGPFADQDHVRDLPRRTFGCGSPGAADGAPSAQVLVQIGVQMPAALHIQGLVDGLWAHTHLLPVYERNGQVVADLLRAPLQTQFRLHHRRKLGVVELGRFGSQALFGGSFLRRIRSIRASTRGRRSVADQLATDRRQ